jgi:macrolide transport system ATP-binding/permease protein
MTTTPSPRAGGHAHVSALDVSVIRGGRTILDRLSVTITPGMRLGVVGENGQGKSTLIQMLAGVLEPDAGTVSRFGRIGVADQELTTVDRTVGHLIDVELADARAALAGLDRATQALAEAQPGSDYEYARALDQVTILDAWEADRRVDIALGELGAITDRERPLATMSVGERYRVRLACLLGAAHDFLLLDEPTNHLDAHGLDFLTAALRSMGAGVVLVSHDRVLLADVATSVLDLDPSIDGRAQLYGDGYPGYLAGRQAQRARWAQAYADHQAEHARLAADLSAAQNRLRTAWRPPKGTGKHQRATRAPAQVRSVNRRLDLLHAHDISKPPQPLQFTLPRLPALPGSTVLHARDITVAGRLPTPVDVAVPSGGRLLITGPNGAGKSTLLAVLAGALPPTTGTVTRAPSARIGVVGQESPRADRRTPLQLYQAATSRLAGPGIDEHDIVPLRALGLLSTTEVSRPLTDLSLGQQRRLDLALALAGRPHALLLDEPTNHLSIALVDELTDALQTTPAAVLIATHDRQLRRDLRDWPYLNILPVRLPTRPT